jgi:transcriptional regulator with XRE-family HTH domain
MAKSQEKSQKNFQINLRAFLKARDLTQKQLAEELGVRPQTVNDWLSENKDKANVTLSTLDKIATRLKCHPYELIMDAKERESLDAVRRVNEDLLQSMVQSRSRASGTPKN